MNTKVSIDEFVSHRKDYVDENGVLYKGAVTTEKRYDEEKRTARFVMSSEASDRMRDVVVQEGIDLSNFIKNPIGLAYHRHDSPIGMWKNVEVMGNTRPKRTEGDLVIYEEGISEKADEIARLLSVGGLKAVSVGFMPKEADYIRNDDGIWTGGYRIIECDLLECSVVAIPAQPAALMKAAGGNVPLVAEALEYILDTYCEKTTGGLFVRKEFEDAYMRMKRPAPASKDAISVAVDIDIGEAEKRVDGLLERLRKGVAEIFAPHEPVQPEKAQKGEDEYQAITFQRDGDKVSVIGEWPKKMRADAEILEKDFAWKGADDEGKIAPILEIKVSGQIARYQPAAGVMGHDDVKTVYFDLIEIKDIEEEPKAPVLVKGSRAQAEATIAKLKASLVESGALS